MVTTKKTAALRISALVAYAAMFGADFCFVFIPVFRKEPSGIFSDYPILLKPAMPTFAILGLIYLLLAMYAVWQLTLQRAPAELVNKINARFIILAIARIAWTIAWHYKNPALTMLFMLIVLICLILIIRLIAAEDLTRRERFFIKLPFFFLFGWISVTTFANAGAFFVSLGIESFGPLSEGIAIATLAAGTILGMWTGIYFKSTSFLLVIIWSFAGILLRYTTTDGMRLQYPHLVNATAACIALLAVALGIEIRNKLRKNKPE